VVLRVEDLDRSRVRAEALRGAIDDLRWLGLTWDEGPDVGGPSGPYVQSERFERYEAALQTLRAAELVYPCTCTRAEVARAASAPHPEDEGPTYPGTCARRRASDAEALGDAHFAWRFRVPVGSLAWDDRVLGRQAIDPSLLGGDFVVARAGQGPSYQLAVVVDDAQMGVTQVIRGQDLVPSTPRQVLLFRALGWDVPEFAHVPLVVGPDGRRLAKREGSIKLAALRAAGVDPLDFNGWLAYTLGLSEVAEPTPPAALLPRFAPGRIPKRPWQVTAEDLTAFFGGRVPAS
jgi:glutamyl-tRNA synthetase